MTRVVVDLNEADLLAKLKNFEDHFVERKVVKDDKDWKKTAVAFANSAPVGLPAVLYIGVRDNGEIEAPQRNLDDAQKKFNAMMEKVIPESLSSRRLSMTVDSKRSPSLSLVVNPSHTLGGYRMSVEVLRVPKPPKISTLN
jgi:predicted HTH transcriptional regulator